MGGAPGSVAGSMASGDKALNGWNSEIASLPGAHILQTWEWSQFKAIYGWRPIPKVWRDANSNVAAAAMILERLGRLGGIGPQFKVIYVPRGPMLHWEDAVQRSRVLDDLQLLARKENAIFIKIDPEVPLGKGVPASPEDRLDPLGQTISTELTSRGWIFSQDQIQFKNTVYLDLSGSEDDWLSRMKQKTRYNLRLAEKKGVMIRRGTLEDLPEAYRMYAETSVRDGFVIRSEEYYQHVWQSFMKAGMADLLLAEFEGQAVAGLFLFYFAGRAWYLYGMSRAVHRDKMPNYLLQWEAMRAARGHGCLLYDLWGAPDDFDAQDSMYGVFRFKEGLGGEVSRFIGAWDYVAKPLYYQMYTNFLPKMLSVMRRRGKAQVRREVSL